MNCPNCGNVVVVNKNRCDRCGKDLTVYKKVYRLACIYYNHGLEKAKVRDLSGAVLMLKKSLEMNKRGTDARNLLGLVLFEMGETVAALSEWVISKHFQSENNNADMYIEAIQANPSKLDALNQAVKKYNIALDAAKHGSDDMAIIQLKKVVNLNPRFIRALQLLALVYMRNNELERAKRCLSRAGKIDISNTMTLQYIKELNKIVTGGTAGEIPYWSDGDITGGSSKQAIEPVMSYREEKPNILAWVSLVLGIVVGIAFFFFLIIPTVKQNILEEFTKEQLDYSSEINIKLARITSLEKELESSQRDLEQTKSELAAITVPEYNPDMYNYLFTAISQYLEYIKIDQPKEAELLLMAETLAKVDKKALEQKESKDLFDIMKNEVYPPAAVIAYQSGKVLVDSGDFQDGLDLLLASYSYNPDTDGTLYYLGKAYQNLENPEQAANYYNELISKFPQSSLAGYTKQRLQELGQID